jgi:hypothetical protein
MRAPQWHQKRKKVVKSDTPVTG